MRETNSGLVKTLFDHFNQKNSTALMGLLAADFVRHDLGSFYPDVVGPEGVREFVEALWRAMPDQTLTIEDIIEAGDKVAVRFSGEGTFRGEFRGLSPTGAKIRWNGINIYRVVDGRVAETWQLSDYLALLEQMGAVSSAILGHRGPCWSRASSTRRPAMA